MKNAVFFVMPEFCGPALMGWPACKEQISGRVFYKPFAKEVTPVRLTWCVIDSCTDWETVLYEWVSPGHCNMIAGKVVAGGIVAHMIGDFAPIDKTAARGAFWNIPFSQFSSLCKYLGVDVHSDDTLYKRLERMIKACLPGLSPDQLRDINLKRVTKSVPLEEFIESDVITDLLHDEDKRDAEDTKKAKIKKDATAQEYLKEFAATYRKAPGGKGTAGKGKVPAAAAAKYPKARPVFTEAVTDDDVNRFMPPGYRVWADFYNARWQLSRGTHRMLSSSFKLYGFASAAHMLLEEAWADFSSRGGFPCPWPSVVVAGPVAAGAGAASASGPA